MSGKGLYAGTGVRVPATYQSDDGAKLKLQQLETGLVGSYEAAKASDKAMPLTIRLSFRGNAEAVRKLAAFFDLYGEGAEFRARGFLPGVARDPSSADPLLAAAVEGATELKGLPPGPIEAEFVEEGDDDE